MRECSVAGCGRVVRTRGYCNMHHQRFLKKGSATAEVQLRAPDDVRFWLKVDRTDDPDECWHWKTKKGSGPYGAFRSKEIGATTAHRYAFFEANGFLPDEVMHTCDVRSCVNPNHLRAGTRSLNMQDMVAKGRGRKGHAKGEAHHGAKLTEGDVRAIRATPSGTTGLAAKYGVDRQTIFAIRTRRIWRHVE